MVPPLVLLAMLRSLRCKGGKHKKASSTSVTENEKVIRVSSSQNLNLKTEENEYEYEQSLCRICLKDGTIPIYGSVDVSEDLNTFAGIEVTFYDTLPKFLCQSCNALLQGAILLRKTAQKSDQILRQPIRDNDNDISMLDSNDLGNELIKAADDIHETFDYDDDNSVEELKDSFYKKEKLKLENKDQVKFYCQKCELEFNTVEEYSEHRLSTEHDRPRKTCPICNKSYVAIYLKRHLTIHTKETHYMCDVCGKKFAILGHFSRHRATHFLDDLPFPCSLCPYKGRFRESLRLHMKSHTGEKSHQCPHCPSRYFVNASNLNKHLLTHKTSRDFTCSQCQRGFYTKRDLDLHIKVDHSGIKDHICNLCGKAFGHRKQMMKHQLKVHKREKLRSGRTPLYILLESKKQLEEQM